MLLSVSLVFCFDGLKALLDLLVLLQLLLWDGIVKKRKMINCLVIMERGRMLTTINIALSDLLFLAYFVWIFFTVLSLWDEVKLKDWNKLLFNINVWVL